MPLQTNVNRLQLTESHYISGLTEESHLSSAFLAKPEEIGSVLAYAFGVENDNVISLLTGGLGNTLRVNNREYEWNVHYQHDRAIELVADSPDAVQATPGRYGVEVQLIFAEKVFGNTDVLLADDNETQIRISGEPYQSGNGWVMRGVIMNPNNDAFIEPEYLKAGARWSKEWSAVAEFSEKGGGSEYSTPVKLRNHLSTFRKTYTVTGNVAKMIMLIDLYSPDGSQKTRMWTKLAEWHNMARWYQELDRSYIYSQYNKDSKGYVKLKDDNQRPVYQGAGLREQIAPANKRYYTKLTYEILDEFLLDLSYAAKRFGGDHKFVALTGKMGMREFDRAIKEYTSGNNITVTDSGTFITGKGDELKFTGYFKTVQFMNGIELTLKEFAPYDDIVRNRKLHPISGKPIESYRFTIMNFGRRDGKSNIRKVTLADREDLMWHVNGSTDPMGGVAKSINMQRSSGIDGYEVHFLSECGIQVEDPLSCGELIMKVV